MKYDLLEEILKQFVAFGDNLVGAILILLIGFIIVRIVTRFVRKVLKKVGIDRLADRYLNDIEFLSKNNIRVVPSVLFSKIVYYLLLLIVLVAATDVLGMQAVSNLVKDAINYIPSLILAAAILIIGLFLADLIKNIAQTALASLNIPAGKFLANFLFYFVLINILILALEQAKINTSFINSNLSIILGGVVLAFAIGYGFASRSVMSNYIAHFYSKNKVNIGDTIKINEKEGLVSDMDNTTITMVSERDGREIIIPLSHLSTEIVEIIKRKSKSPSQPPV
ncbi:MAG: mechanosensitive ion channel domain-containing protein [Bacteroidota bacterium]